MKIDIKRDKDGIRYVRPYLGINAATGKPIRPYKRFPEAISDEEAAELARAWLAEQYPAAAEGSTIRVGDLLSRYVAVMEEGGSPKNTVKTYRHLARHAAAIAAMDARDVRPHHLERMYRELMRPKEDGGTGLDNSSVILLHNFLSGAFGWMAHVGVVGANPVRDARKPSPGAYEAVVFDGVDFDRLNGMLEGKLADTDADRIEREAAFGALLALHTGMRVGEVCALRRMDVQMPLGRILVRGTLVESGGLHRQPATKGKHHRAVSVSAGVLEGIRSHELYLAERLGRRGNSSPMVTVDGGFMRPSKLSNLFRQMCHENGMPGYRFHSLRHTHATMLLARGFDAKTVCERMGHASVATTLRLYAHVLPGRDAAAAEAFDDMARGGAAW